MSDLFGISSALQAITEIYFQSARRTGRTASLVESVKDGDVLIFTNQNEAKRVQRLCADRGVSVVTRVIDPKRRSAIFEHVFTADGRMIFDHSFVEDYFRQLIIDGSNHLEKIQREASGDGEAHRDTRRKAEEISRWKR